MRLDAQDRLLSSKQAEMLFTPRTVAAPSRRVLTPEQVQQILQVLPVREQLIVRLALFSGMRFFFQAEDGIRDGRVTGVQTCALPISTCGRWRRGRCSRAARSSGRRW